MDVGIVRGLSCCFNRLASLVLDTHSDKDIFFRDATRLAHDMCYNQTFNSVQPLLNFWAAFTPSEDVSDKLLPGFTST